MATQVISPAATGSPPGLCSIRKSNRTDLSEHVPTVTWMSSVSP
jgi:hypothetical protein